MITVTATYLPYVFLLACSYADAFRESISDRVIRVSVYLKKQFSSSSFRSLSEYKQVCEVLR